jgi:class 3 adenylate cyclase/predicted ATPase
MRCSKCGADNREGARFCDNCGAKLSSKCSSCGAENRTDAKFCDSCGAAFGAVATVATPAAKTNETPIRVTETSAAENLEGERKTVTALFADIKGSMELIEDLDPEEARAIVDPALKLMMEAVQRYGGYVAQSTGDGIFALFGAPVAHEDHPQRALYAALRMQEELRRYSERLREQGRTPLSIRVGANTGEVVVRTITTGEGHTEYLPIGHSTSLASRLQVLAAPGAIAISDTVRKLVEGYFALKALGPARIKGVSEPVHISEVTGIGPLRTRIQRAASLGYTKFVGREREIETLQNAAELAKQGHGQIVAVMAEPGVGKSRLFYEFKVKRQSDWMVLEAPSVSHGRASAFLPLVDLLWAYFKITLDDNERTRREKITSRVVALDPSSEDALPYLFELLGLGGANNQIMEVDPQTRKRRVFDAIKRVLLRESLDQPLMVVFEDLHWVDVETQAFLDLLADRIGTSRILMLVSYRPEYSHLWNSKTYYTQLRLDPLGRESADEMLAALLGDGQDLIPLKRLIIEKTEGNPLFMEEIYQALIEEGAMVRDGAGVKLAKSLNQLKIPPTVQGILASRIDRLPVGEKDFLQKLAVIGKEFPFALARKVINRPDDELDKMLDHLQLAEFIYEQPAAGDIEYTFKHALTRDVAYNSVLVERRKVLHERIGAALESLYTVSLDDHLAELAHHYANSSDARKAVEYLGRAAAQSVRRTAHNQAVTYVTSAIERLREWPADAERAQQEIALQLTKGSAVEATFSQAAPEAEKAYSRAYELCGEIDDQPQLFRVMSGLWAVYHVQAKFESAHELAVKLLALAESLPHSLFRLAAHEALGASLLWIGKFASAREHLEQGSSFYDPQKRRAKSFRYVQDPGVDCLAFTALTLWYLGYPDQACRKIDEAIALARSLAHTYTLGYVFAHAAHIQYFCTREQAARESAETAIEICSKHGFAFFLGLAKVYRGWALAQQGKNEEGIAEILQGFDIYMTTGSGINWPTHLILLAETHARMGRIAEGLKAVEEALIAVEKTGERWNEAEVHRLKGMLELRQKDSRIRIEIESPAEEHFRKAIGVARKQGAKSWELRATVSLARLLRDTNRRDEARAMLADIYNWFTEGFDTADLKDSKALLEELSNSR